jgi:hypothetical protein
VTGDRGIFSARGALTQRVHAASLLPVGHTNRRARLHGGLVRVPHAWRFGRAPRAWGALLASPMLRISSGSGPKAMWERARRFVPPAHGD